MATILLLQWSTHLPEIRGRFQFLDLFAGHAQVFTTWFLSHQDLGWLLLFLVTLPALQTPCPTKHFLEDSYRGTFLRTSRGYSSTKFDEIFCPGERTMNFLSSAGFLFACCISFLRGFVIPFKPPYHTRCIPKSAQVSSMDCTLRI